MAPGGQPPLPSSPPGALPKPKSSWPSFLWILLPTLFPVIIAVILYQPEGIDPAPLPADYSFAASVDVPERHNRILSAVERAGEGFLPGPEDLAYDEQEGYLYTGCDDGWIRRVNLVGEKLAVEDWAYVGGRPLGLAFGPGRRLYVAAPNKGIMVVNPDQTVGLLTKEAEGVDLLLPDGVDVAHNGLVYFTDASYKFDIEIHILDILEGRPHGRLVSFDPSTNETALLATDLYFPNGVCLSPDQSSLIFCETLLRRCRKYHITGEKRGTIEIFIDDLPGFPDNIRYDSENNYWIALSTGRTQEWNVILKHPFLRKLMVILKKFKQLPHFLLNDSGVLKVSKEGHPLALYSDPHLSLVTSGLKIGKYLYYGSLDKSYISRINISQYAGNVIT